MGVLSDFLTGSRTQDPSASPVSGDRSVQRELEGVIAAMGDPPYPSGYTAGNEVQAIAEHGEGAAGGTFTLTFSLYGGVSFTTAAINHNANAAAILSAINSAASAVPGWTNGDIAVTGGPLTTDPVVLTFSGASVAGKDHGLTVIDGSLEDSESEPVEPGEITVSTPGQGKRTAWAALKVLGIVGAGMATLGEDVTSVTVVNGRGQFPHKLSEATVRAIIDEAAVADGRESTRTKLLQALGY